jgi:RNA polymerase sigma-70 factor (ECF subfamily)
MPDDQELIRRIAQKDHLAFKMLVDLYQALVLKTCCSLLNDRQNAEDVTQDVFFQIYKSAPVFRHDCRLSTWIRRIAINRCLNFNRDNKKFRWLASLSRTPEEELRGGGALRSSGEDNPESVFRENERRRLIQEAIASLPQQQRTMLLLHKFDGLSYQDIAETLDTSLPAVEACLHRAKANLQKKLSRYLKNI